jgi:ATP-dependent Clp protease adaptor protein ClpS
MASRPPVWRNSDSEFPEFYEPRSLPRYQIVLHRAADKGLLFVVAVLRKLTRFGEAEAMSRMWQSYNHGRAPVIETHLERAELYVEQFATHGLVVSIEPVP